MANYVSQHTGTEIDTAVNYALNDHDTIVAQPWKTLIKNVGSTTTDWVTNTDTAQGHSAAYMASATIQFSGYSATADAPMVWFVDSNGGRYYVDYSLSVSGATGTLHVYSNTRIAGRICVLGLVHAIAIS